MARARAANGGGVGQAFSVPLREPQQMPIPSHPGLKQLGQRGCAVRANGANALLSFVSVNTA